MRSLIAALAFLACLLSGLGAKDAAPDDDSAPFIGVNMRAMEPRDTATYGLPAARGLVITQVFDGSPAAQAGLKAQDAVVAAAGVPLPSGPGAMAAFKASVTAVGKGGKLQLDAMTGTMAKSLTLTPITKGQWKTTFARSLATRITKDVEALRELPAKREISIDLMTRQSFYDKMLFEFNRDTIRADTLKAEKVYTLMGTLPAGIDTQEIFLQMLKGGVLGFYTPEEKSLFLLEGQMGGDYETTMAHEIVHGLQDQYFNLNALPTENHDNSDLAAALRCVIEGDAKVLELDYIKKHQNGNQDRDWLTPQPAGGLFVPPSLPAEKRFALNMMKDMMFPYMQGAQFVKAVHAKGGWDAVNRLYDDWPRSTEQILHHEKFFGPQVDEPVEIDAHDLIDKLDDTTELLVTDVVGELGIARYSLNFLDRQHLDAESFAAGWDGDRMVGGLTKPGAKPYYIWVSSWDTEADAIEFAKGMAAVLQSRYTPGFQRSSIKDMAPVTSLEVDAGADGQALVTRTGSAVLVVQAESRELVADLAAKATALCRMVESVERPMFLAPATPETPSKK